MRARDSRPVLRVVEDDAPAAEEGLRPVAWWRALIWGEWFAHSRLLLGFLVGWLAMVWLLPLVAHPLWILGYGLLVAVIAGPAFGGADVIAGCEEFSFSWPVPRRQRFVARLIVGGGSLVAVSVMGVLALEGNLSDVLLRVFVTSGLPAVQISQPILLYGLVLVVPFNVFALGFALSALSRSRSVALLSWIWGVLGALIVLRGAVQLEEMRFDRLNGYISVPALAIVSLLVLWVASRFYGRKEAGTDSGALRMPPGWWVAAMAILGAIAGIALLGFWFANNLSRLL